jgi:hypothetical protein
MVVLILFGVWVALWVGIIVGDYLAPTPKTCTTTCSLPAPTNGLLLFQHEQQKQYLDQHRSE